MDKLNLIRVDENRLVRVIKDKINEELKESLKEIEYLRKISNQLIEEINCLNWKLNQVR